MIDNRTVPHPEPSGFDGPESLTPELYEELRKLAVGRMIQRKCGTTLQPTMLVHDVWLRMSGRTSPWKDRGHFFAAAAMTMRHILIDHARRRARLRHGGDLDRVDMGNLNLLPEDGPDERLLLLDDGVRELEKVHPLWAQIVVSRFFGGLTNTEIAESLGISERSVGRHWSGAKVWLFRWMQSTRT